MSVSTRSTSSPTLLAGRRSDSRRLILGLLFVCGAGTWATILVLVGASLLLFLVLKAAPSDERRMASAGRESAAASTAGSGRRPHRARRAWPASTIWLGGGAVGDFGTSHALQRGPARLGPHLARHARSFLLLAAGLSACAGLGRPGGQHHPALCASVRLRRALGGGDRPRFGNPRIPVRICLRGRRQPAHFFRRVAEGWWSAAALVSPSRQCRFHAVAVRRGDPCGRRRGTHGSGPDDFAAKWCTPPRATTWPGCACRG